MTSMKIDAHIHFTPPELAADLAQFAEREPYWGLLLDPPAGKSIQGWASPERMLADMDAAGIDKVVIVGEYFQQHQSCVARNDQAIELVKRWPDRIVAMGTIQPAAGDAALDEFERCLDHGLSGAGELNPYAQGIDLFDKRFLQLVERCILRDQPLNLHVSEEIGGYYLGKSTTPLRHYYDLACRYPELKLILAHWGGGLLFYEMMPRVRKQLRNVWYDTAASPLLYPTQKIFPAALACIDHQKILYGSDYPLLIYPRKMSEPDLRPLPAAIAKLALAPDVEADIMGRNAARLFRLLPDSVAPAGSGAISKKGELPTGLDLPLSALMPVPAVAEQWPETIPIFEENGIPWEDRPVPSWEPIVQAAVRVGLGPDGQNKLLNRLNEAVVGDKRDEIE